MVTVSVPESELRFSFSRSGGKGGQNVNKVETKVAVRWDLEHSSLLSEDEKFLVRTRLARRLDSKGNIVVSAERERTQKDNRRLAIAALNNLIKKALAKKPRRKPTYPSRAVKERRLREKHRVTEKKEMRRSVRIGA